MHVVIAQGETIKVELEGTDGWFEISYGGKAKDHLTVDAELADTTGRVGRVYDEDFSQETFAAKFGNVIGADLPDERTDGALEETLQTLAPDYGKEVAYHPIGSLRMATPAYAKALRLHEEIEALQDHPALNNYYRLDVSLGTIEGWRGMSPIGKRRALYTALGVTPPDKEEYR